MNLVLSVLASLAFLLSTISLPTPSPTSVKATLITNVRIYDGGGEPSYAGSVRIVGDRITAVGKLSPSPDDEVIDGKGLALAPGFIDMHSHASSGIFDRPSAEVMIRQGITTSFVGQDGESDYPLADFFTKLENHPTALNFVSMVGQGTLREQVMGKDLLRPSTDAELQRMKQLLAQEMDSGAFGMSTGLEYDPAHFSTTDEVVELSKVAAAKGGFYISHVRDEGNAVFNSFNEITEIGKRANLPVEISHIKLGTTPVWHLAKDRMPAIFAEAEKQKVDLKADVYPYTYWHSGIRVIMLDRDYFNPTKVAKVIAENGGADHIRFVHYQPDPRANGKNLQEIAEMWGVTPVEAYMRIVKATLPRSDGKTPAEDVIVTSMSEDDLSWFIANPKIMFCSDGGLTMHHPRSAGAFPRILGRYVRELKVLSLEEAVRKMTSMPAEQLGLENRGRIASGYIADLVLFDPATVKDNSTIEQWDGAPSGIPSVMVSGVWELRDGKITGQFAGKGIRHAAGAATGDKSSAATGDPGPNGTYGYIRLGNPTEVTPAHQAGTAMMGGGKDLDPAFQWMCSRAGGGDFLILRAHGSDDYNPYVAGLCPALNSVSTLVISNRTSANDPAVEKIIHQAEAIFIAGGDQSNYINFWQGTATQRAINDSIHHGTVIGGTSAGLAVLTQYVFTALNDSAYSKETLADPYNKTVTIGKGFLDIPVLRGTISDQHFVKRDRLGRFVGFLARILQDKMSRDIHGIAVDERNALLVEPNGESRLVGNGAAYLIHPEHPPETCTAGKPLTMRNIDVYKITADGTFNVRSWKGTGGVSYQLSAVNGELTSTQANGSVY